VLKWGVNWLAVLCSELYRRGALGPQNSLQDHCDGSLHTHSVLCQLQQMVANTTPQLDSTEDMYMNLELASIVPHSGVRDATVMRPIQASTFGLLWAHADK
jgi:hypothetical protein